MVDFVSTHFDARHLEETPARLREISGALEIVPLPRPIELLGQVRTYLETHLIGGEEPDWRDLDTFADAISAIDYYLERLAEDNPAAAEDILTVAERSLLTLRDRVGDSLTSADDAVGTEAPADTALARARSTSASHPALVESSQCCRTISPAW